MTDQKLEESIFQLQKNNTANGVKQLAEEAAQLFAHGRHIEAGALLEKAEAIMANGGTAPPMGKPASSGPVGQAHQTKTEERGKVDEQTMANIAGKLADGLSTALKGAFQELERHLVGESLKISTSFEQQIERLQSTVGGLSQLKVKFEQLTEAVSEERSAGAVVGQKHEQLSGVVTTLQEITSRHETEFGALRAETTALRGETTGMVQKVEGLSARVGTHQEELTGLKSSVSDVSRRVGGFIERIDRQAEVLRALSDTQARRAAALDELLGVLTRLKAPAESLVAMAAGQL